MQRRSILPWIIAFVLFLSSLFAGVLGLFPRSRSSVIHRDDIHKPLIEMIDAGAIDLDKAAEVVHAEPRSLDAAERRGELTHAVIWAVSDPVLARTLREWRNTSNLFLGFAAVNFACSVAVALHTFLSRPLLNRLW